MNFRNDFMPKICLHVMILNAKLKVKYNGHSRRIVGFQSMAMVMIISTIRGFMMGFYGILSYFQYDGALAVQSEFTKNGLWRGGNNV